MKKHDPDRQHRPMFPGDFSVMPCLVERSHENSPVSSSSKESLVPDSRSPTKLSPTPPNSLKQTCSTSSTHLSSSKLNGSSSSSFDDSGFQVTSPKSKNIVELRAYIKKLKDKNKVLEEENKQLHDEMSYKIKFQSDLQQKYDDCIDTIVELNSKINQLENGCNLDSSSQTTVSLHLSEVKDQEIFDLKRHIRNIEEDSKLWRVRCNLLDVDNNVLKHQINEMEQTIIELRQGTGDQSRSPSNRSKSNLSNRLSPKLRNLPFDPINKPERDVPVATTDKDNLNQHLPPIETKTSKRPSQSKEAQPSTKFRDVRSNTPCLPPIECLVGRSKYHPRPPPHPNPKLPQSSTRSATPISNPILPPTNDHFKLPHLPFPPSKPKTSKTRKYFG